MRGAFEQFYRTWCYAGHSVSGADGWKIRAKSAGLPLPEAEGMADLANYWVPTRLSPATPPGTRLALFRPSATQAVLVHGVLRPGLVGGRAGVSFEHVIARLPPTFSAFEAVRLWHSPGWRLDDGDFGPALSPFVWDEQACGPEFRAGAVAPTGWEAAPADPAAEADALAASLVEHYPGLPWAYALQACIALGQRTVEKVFIAGPDDEIIRLLYVTFYCLPASFREQLTFSTHENPKGTKGVKIVGVTTFEGEEPDLPGFCYEGQYRALNLFTGNRSDGLELGPFAASAIDWLRCGQGAYVRQIRERFEDLNPSDNAGLRELDLLSQEQSRGEDLVSQPEALLEVCASPPIARARISRPTELARILACAAASEDFQARLTREWSGWLPADPIASEQLVAALAGTAHGELERQAPFERVQRASQFGRMVDPGLGERIEERLLQLCQAAAREASVPPIDLRLRLLESWLALPSGPEFLPEHAPARWLEASPVELSRFLTSQLPFRFKRQALETGLQASGRIDPMAADALAPAVCADPLLTRELFLQLPQWRQAGPTVAASLADRIGSRVIETYSQSLTLVAALRAEEPRLLEAIEAWEAQAPAAVPERLRTILALGRYLRQPSATASLAGEILSRPFWWAEGAKEEAVNAALDQLLSVGTLEDFERALEWFGHGAWALSPPELIRLASHRLAQPAPGAKAADPVLRELVDLLAQVLKEWEQTRKAALGAGPTANDKSSTLGARSISVLARISLHYLPSAAFLKSPAGRSLLRLFKKESHLLAPEQKERFQKLYDLLEASAAREATAESLLILAISSLDACFDSDLRGDATRRFQAEAARSPKLIRPFLRQFFDTKTELCTRQFLPGFLDYVAEREHKMKDKSVTEECALAIRDLGGDLTAREPAIVENLKEFLKKLAPRSRERFERLLHQTDAPTAKWPPRQGPILPPRHRSIFRLLISEPALYLYFYAVVLATGILAFYFRHQIVHFFNQVFFP